MGDCRSGPIWLVWSLHVLGHHTPPSFPHHKLWQVRSQVSTSRIRANSREFNEFARSKGVERTVLARNDPPPAPKGCITHSSPRALRAYPWACLASYWRVARGSKRCVHIYRGGNATASVLAYDRTTSERGKRERQRERQSKRPDTTEPDTIFSLQLTQFSLRKVGESFCGRAGPRHTQLDNYQSRPGTIVHQICTA